MGNAEKEDIHVVIANAVSVAVKNEMKKERKYTLGMYVILIAIFISIAWPINDKVYNLNSLFTELKEILKQKADNDFVMEHFLTKDQYIYLNKEHSKAAERALQSPKDCHVIFRESTANQSEWLGVRWRGND